MKQISAIVLALSASAHALALPTLQAEPNTTAQVVFNIVATNLAPFTALSDNQVSSLLSQVTSTPNITFDQTDRSTILNGLKTTTGLDGAMLFVVAKSGSMDSTVLAGMVADMYNAADTANNDVNAVRAVAVPTGSQPTAMMSLCLYPAVADGDQATDFCLGRDGSLDAPASKRDMPLASLEKRSIIGAVCELVDIPILCFIAG